MIIQSGNLSMSSERNYSAKRSAQFSICEGDGMSFLESLEGPIYNLEDGKSYCPDPDAKENSDQEQAITYNKQGLFADGALSDPFGSYGNRAANNRNVSFGDLRALTDGTDFSKQNLKMQFQTLNFLFRLFFTRQAAGGSMDLSGYLNANGGRYQSYTFTETYEESESTSFETTGTVVTKDGRELNFNLSVGMSREFYRQSSVSYLREKNPLIDPLVIHLDENIDSVSDQSFYFDIDSDGTEDEIAKLAPGSGFLALDRNGDGTINDGSELFGAETGDGFGELAEFDLDGNGWIDEADEVFDRLKIWSADRDGNMRLATLKESNIGAICLQSAPTQFSVNDPNNDTKAVVRATGFFLREDTGTPGVMQQVDFAKKLAS